MCVSELLLLDVSVYVCLCVWVNKYKKQKLWRTHKAKTVYSEEDFLYSVIICHVKHFGYYIEPSSGLLVCDVVFSECKK